MKRLLAALTALVLSTAAASAASVTCGSFIYKLEASSSAGCFSGNDTGNNGISQADAYFGLTGWTYGQKMSAGGTASGGDGAVKFTDALVSGEGGGGNGTWAVSDYSSIASRIMITIKKQNGFAAFLVDAGVTSGIWRTYKIPSFNDNNVISHSAVFYVPGSTNVVPLPAAAWLLLGALGGLALLRRKRVAA